MPSLTGAHCVAHRDLPTGRLRREPPPRVHLRTPAAIPRGSSCRTTRPVRRAHGNRSGRRGVPAPVLLPPCGAGKAARAAPPLRSAHRTLFSPPGGRPPTDAVVLRPVPPGDESGPDEPRAESVAREGLAVESPRRHRYGRPP